MSAFSYSTLARNVHRTCVMLSKVPVKICCLFTAIKFLGILLEQRVTFLGMFILFLSVLFHKILGDIAWSFQTTMFSILFKFLAWNVICRQLIHFPCFYMMVFFPNRRTQLEDTFSLHKVARLPPCYGTQEFHFHIWTFWKQIRWNGPASRCCAFDCTFFTWWSYSDEIVLKLLLVFADVQSLFALFFQNFWNNYSIIYTRASDVMGFLGDFFMKGCYGQSQYSFCGFVRISVQALYSRTRYLHMKVWD